MTIVLTLFDGREDMSRFEEHQIIEMLPVEYEFVRQVNAAPEKTSFWFDRVLHLERMTPIIKCVVYDGTANDDIDPDKEYAMFIYEGVLRSYQEMVDVARNLDRKWECPEPTHFIVGQMFLCTSL